MPKRVTDSQRAAQAKARMPASRGLPDPNPSPNPTPNLSPDLTLALALALALIVQVFTAEANGFS